MRIINNKNLTRREQDIIMQILLGKNKGDIAKTLSVSVSTVKTNVENLYRKFDVHNKVELVIYAIKNKIIDIDTEE